MGVIIIIRVRNILLDKFGFIILVEKLGNMEGVVNLKGKKNEKEGDNLLINIIVWLKRKRLVAKSQKVKNNCQLT